MSDWYARIQEQYKKLQGDSTALFEEILRAAGEIGMESALASLEQCAIEKRTAWLKANLAQPPSESDPLLAGYHWFYERYLRVSVPEDGEIVEHTPKQLVMRWWNPCPTLEACRKLGLDTRQVCRRAYHEPVQVFLRQVHPRLRFERNYENIRPYADYCEEILFLEDDGQHYQRRQT